MSPIGKPKTKESKLIKELNILVEKEKEDIDEFTMKRLKSEAEKLKGKDAAAAFSVLGMIACIEEDIESMHSHHKNAITHSNEDIGDLYQYVVSLMNCKLYQEAYVYALKVYEKDPTKLDNLNMLISSTCELNLKEEFEEFTSKWFDLAQTPHILTIYSKDLLLSVVRAKDQMRKGTKYLSYEEVYGG